MLLWNKLEHAHSSRGKVMSCGIDCEGLEVLGLQVPELLLDLGQRSLILRLLRRNVLKLGLQGNYLLGKPCDIQVFFLERGKRRLTLGCPQVLEEMEKEVGQSWYLHLLLQAESLS